MVEGDGAGAEAIDEGRRVGLQHEEDGLSISYAADGGAMSSNDHKVGAQS